MAQPIDIHFTSFETRSPYSVYVLRVSTDMVGRREIVKTLREGISSWAVNTIEGRKAWVEDGEWLSFESVLRRHIFFPTLQRTLANAGITFIGVEKMNADMSFDIDSSTITPDGQVLLQEMQVKCLVDPWMQ